MIRRRTIKTAAAGIVILSGLGFLFYSSMADNIEYYKTVDEIVDEMDEWRGVRLRLAGNVGEGSVLNKPGTHDYIFRVEKRGAAIPVKYTGQLPDSFAENIEVAVSGSLSKEGFFEAERVFTRCPSKYESKLPPSEQSFSHPENIPKK